MVSFNLKVLAKFGLCSNCSQKLDGCSLARARKIFPTACQMLVLAKTLCSHARRCSQRPFYTPLVHYKKTIRAKQVKVHFAYFVKRDV